MKKIIVISLLFSIITSDGILAQGMPGIDTAGYKFWKNEIGANIAPIIGSALGGFMPEPQYSISYKRILKGGNALRLNAAVQQYLKDQNSYTDPKYPDNYELVSQSVNTEIRRYDEKKRDPKFQFGIGYEWRRGTKRLSRFYGADMIVGKMSTAYTRKDYFMVLDSTPNTYSSGPYWVIDPANKIPSTAFASRTNTFYVGLSPFYGLRYPITKRLILTAQTGFDLSMAIGNYQTNDYANNIHLSGMVTTFNLDTRGFISEVNLVYRF